MNKQKILLVGSSGFAGNHIMQELAKKDVELITLSRKIPNNLPSNATNLIFDFDKLSADSHLPSSDHLVICLGTPLKVWDLIYLKKKDISSFIKIDKQHVINLAKAAKKSGIQKISIVSAVGANSKSFNTYLKTKGEVEDQIISMNFESTNIFRPAHMCGRIDWEKNKNSYRFDVFLGEYISLLTKPFMIGGLIDYKGVDVKILSQSVVKNLSNNSTGIQYFTYKNFN
tara:strand:- start:387 stop:1070 length:684 start_codon:yes stop_codon:yes gene_type:complete